MCRGARNFCPRPKFQKENFVTLNAGNLRQGMIMIKLMIMLLLLSMICNYAALFIALNNIVH